MGWRDSKKPPDKSLPGKTPPAKPRRASWRDPQDQTAPAGTVRRSWWKSQHSDQGRQMSYRARLAIWTALLAILIAAFVWVLPQWERTVPLVALRFTDYESEFLPPNAWAAEDLERFADQFDPSSSHANVAAQCNPWSAITADAALVQLGEAIEDAQPGGPNKDVILVYLTAHGVVDSSGRPCLLLGFSDPTDEQTWLPMSQVLDEVSKHHPRQKKLLVLDCNRMLVNWSCGLLYNSFADGLEALVSDRKAPNNLAVLNSTSPGQFAWAAPELGGSAFGYFFFQGLRGRWRGRWKSRRPDRAARAGRLSRSPGRDLDERAPLRPSASPPAAGQRR